MSTLQGVDEFLDYFEKVTKETRASAEFMNMLISTLLNNDTYLNTIIKTLKEKLDFIDEGANKTIVDESLSNTSDNPVSNKAIKNALDRKSSTNHSHSNYLTAHPPVTKTNDTTSNTTLNSGGNFEVIDSVVRDEFGHITTINVKKVTLPTFPTSLKNPNNITINGKNYNGATAVDVGTIGIAYGGTGATTVSGVRSNLEVAHEVTISNQSGLDMNNYTTSGIYHFKSCSFSANYPASTGALGTLIVDTSSNAPNQIYIHDQGHGIWQRWCTTGNLNSWGAWTPISTLNYGVTSSVTSGSSALLTSGGAYSAISNKLDISGGRMTGIIITPNATNGIAIGDDIFLADNNVENTLFLVGNANPNVAYINFGSNMNSRNYWIGRESNNDLRIHSANTVNISGANGVGLDGKIWIDSPIEGICVQLTKLEFYVKLRS